MVNKDAAFNDKLFRTDVPVVEHDGRWFITFDHPGFNSPTNNRDGYFSEHQALRAMRRYTRTQVKA